MNNDPILGANQHRSNKLLYRAEVARRTHSPLDSGDSLCLECLSESNRLIFHQEGYRVKPDPETVISYELGAKTRLFNDRVQLNIAVFDTTIGITKKSDSGINVAVVLTL